MRPSLKAKIINVCNQKIAAKGAEAGLSFYVFFSNENDGPHLLMEAAHWWIEEQKLNHLKKL